MISFYLIIVGAVAYWVYQDSQKRNMSTLWGMGIFVAALVSARTFLIPLVFILLLYSIYRKPVSCNREEEEIVRICFKCGKKIGEGDRYCPSCGTDTQNWR
jgi:cbb3-type cytochrome oxidase subunit 3